ncbi:MAG: cupin domain-containing protein [Vicingaceae bacterium]
MKEIKSINLREKFQIFNEKWTPKNIAACNGQLVKIAKVSGEFIWHSHAEEDELFLVIKGHLIIELEGKKEIHLQEGEMTVIPKGTEHKPRTEESECWIMMIEPDSTRNTGQHLNDFSKPDLEWI